MSMIFPSISTEKEYAPTSEMMADLYELEREITADLADLKGML